MLHEIIVTLSGFNGSLLHNLDTCPELKDFLHPGEISLLNKILAIAKNYKFLKDFIEINHAPVFGEKENDLQTLPGQYIQAFCEGLEEVLKPYNEDLIKLEENVLIGPDLTLVYIFSHVDKYSSLFMLLMSLIKQILTEKLHGCQILKLLYENILSAVDEAKEYLRSLLKRCYGVFLEQTTNWLMNGILVDPFGEYVIRKIVAKKESLEEENCSPLRVQNEGFLNENNNDNGYEVAITFIPLCINYTLVNSILFVGQLVRILNSNPRNTSEANSLNGNLIFSSKEKYFFEKFLSLRKSESSDMGELEDLVLEIRECVVQHLWKVAVEEENLYEELQLLKNFYLLGFGPFFKDFLLEASALSLDSHKKHFSHDLNDALNGVACSYPHIDDVMLSKFVFKIIPSKTKDASKTETLWSSIKLQYTAKWPLNLIFTPVAIEHYNKLFLFLLRVKRCQIGIHNIWKNDTKNKHKGCMKAWMLRNELMFWINNLQFYLQVDVIETEYCNLMNEIRKVKDFQQIEKLHNIFLLNVLSHSFLLHVPTENVSNSNAVPSSSYPEYFYAALLNTIKICEKFCILTSQGNLESKSKEISKLDKNFREYKTVVLCFLSEYQSQPFKQHSVKLLLRLNFNQWISKNLLRIPEC